MKMLNKLNSDFIRWFMLGWTGMDVIFWLLSMRSNTYTLFSVIVFAASWMMHISHTMTVADDAMEDDE